MKYQVKENFLKQRTLLRIQRTLWQLQNNHGWTIFMKRWLHDTEMLFPTRRTNGMSVNPRRELLTVST